MIPLQDDRLEYGRLEYGRAAGSVPTLSATP
jgi:hypothetical protein